MPFLTGLLLLSFLSPVATFSFVVLVDTPHDQPYGFYHDVMNAAANATSATYSGEGGAPTHWDFFCPDEAADTKYNCVHDIQKYNVTAYPNILVVAGGKAPKWSGTRVDLRDLKANMTRDFSLQEDSTYWIGVGYDVANFFQSINLAKSGAITPSYYSNYTWNAKRSIAKFNATGAYWAVGALAALIPADAKIAYVQFNYTKQVPLLQPEQQEKYKAFVRGVQYVNPSQEVSVYSLDFSHLSQPLTPYSAYDPTNKTLGAEIRGLVRNTTRVVLNHESIIFSDLGLYNSDLFAEVAEQKRKKTASTSRIFSMGDSFTATFNRTGGKLHQGITDVVLLNVGLASWEMLTAAFKGFRLFQQYGTIPGYGGSPKVYTFKDQAVSTLWTVNRTIPSTKFFWNDRSPAFEPPYIKGIPNIKDEEIYNMMKHSCGDGENLYKYLVDMVSKVLHKNDSPSPYGDKFCQVTEKHCYVYQPYQDNPAVVKCEWVRTHECGLDPQPALGHLCKRTNRIRRIGVGIYINNIADVNTQIGSFFVDWNLFLYEETTRYKDLNHAKGAGEICDLDHNPFTPLTNVSADTLEQFLTFVGADRFQKIVKHELLNSDGVLTNVLWNIKGVQYFRMDITRWPFATQKLTITIEEATDGTERSEIVFCKVTEYTALSPSIRLAGFDSPLDSLTYATDTSDVCGPPFKHPNNTKCIAGTDRNCTMCAHPIVNATHPSSDHVSCKCMGGLRLNSRYKFTIMYSIPMLASILRVFLPPAFITILTNAVYFMTPDKYETKLGICASGLLSAVMYHAGLATQTPASNQNTAADRFMVIVYVVNFVAWITTVIMMIMFQAKLHRLTRLSFFFVRLVGPIITVGLVALFSIAATVSSTGWIVSSSLFLVIIPIITALMYRSGLGCCAFMINRTRFWTALQNWEDSIGGNLTGETKLLPIHQDDISDDEVTNGSMWTSVLPAPPVDGDGHHDPLELAELAAHGNGNSNANGNGTFLSFRGATRTEELQPLKPHK